MKPEPLYWVRVATSPAKLVAKILKILKREFVIMVELLWNNIEVEWHRCGSDTTSNQPRMPQRYQTYLAGSSVLEVWWPANTQHATTNVFVEWSKLNSSLYVCSNLFGAEQ